MLFGALYFSFSPQIFGFQTSSSPGLEVGHLTLKTRASVVAVCKTSEKKVLVTGAAGFIGSHSSVGLAKIGYAVIGLDNFNLYYPVSLKLARESDLIAQGIPVIHADINDYELLQDLFKACPFTHVLHLAAQAGVRYAAKHPFTYIESNVYGSVKLLEVMRNQKPIPRLVYASSSSVYGLSKSLPFSERDRADLPASLYAATKRSQELLTFTYFNNFGLSATGERCWLFLLACLCMRCTAVCVCDVACFIPVQHALFTAVCCLLFLCARQHLSLCFLKTRKALLFPP